MPGFADDFKALYDEIRSLIGLGPSAAPKPQQSNLKNDVPTGDGTYTPPLHGSWKSSGGFSFQATDKRHPHGHMGVDMRIAGGSPVFSYGPGIVTNVGTDPSGGNVVNIQHPNGLRTYYAHLGTISVHKGDKVDANTQIATVGDTGSASKTAPHLHFQIWQNGQIQDPAKYFSIPKYENLSKGEEIWLPGAKEVAQNWSMNQHLNNKMASNKILIMKCNEFYIQSHLFK